MEDKEEKEISISIVGGGFSGTAVALHLIETSTKRISISLIEKASVLAQGVAYSTAAAWHPLNVQADQMGAYADYPEGFCQWLEAHREEWRRQDPDFQKLVVLPNSFLPRKLYGEYLKYLLEEAKQRAAQKGFSFTILQDEAIDANKDSSEKIALQLKSGKILVSDYLVIAVGVPPVKELPFETPELLRDPRYTHDPWKLTPEEIIHQGDCTPRHPECQVLAIGTGLTMVDVFASYLSVGFDGMFIAMSQNGYIPEAQESESLPLRPFYKSADFPSDLLGIFKKIRQDIASAQLTGDSWKLVIDALRPCTPALWKKMSLSEKKRFLRHLIFLWNKHRHRMSPDSAAMIEKLSHQSRFQVLQGMVEGIDTTSKDALYVHYRQKDSSMKIIIPVKHVVNCSGPEYTVGRRHDSFLEALCNKGLATPDSLGMGFKISAGLALASSIKDRVFSIGGLLFGELFETTAVPEIREQAAMIAKSITQDRAM